MQDWTDAVIGFLGRHLPADERGGWSDNSISAYQICCNALVALGQADTTPWGAAQRPDPRLPDALPRWDDICVAVLKLAQQARLISWRTATGDLPQPRRRPGDYMITHIGAPTPPPPNILPAHGLGPAHARSEAADVLAALGLVADGCWTAGAEPVLWRVQPDPWAMNVAADPRFAAAADHAVSTLPDDLRARIAGLADLNAGDILIVLAQHAASVEESRARFGPRAVLPHRLSPDQARRRLVVQRANELDRIFFARWRLADGWLTPDAAARAVPVFHDPLAIALRKAVVGRLHPGFAATGP